MITPNDPIIGPPRGTPEDARSGYKRITNGARASTDLINYFYEVYRLAPLVGIDPAIVVAQSAVETGNFGTVPGAGATAWLERRNPGSIGITSTGKPGEKDIDAGHSWKDGTDAAKGQIIHLLAYSDGHGFTAANKAAVSDLFRNYAHLDPRWQAVDAAGYMGTVRLLSDLGNGRWAADKDYAQKIADRGNQLFGFTEETPVAITFGRVENPGFFDRPIWKAEGRGQNYLGDRVLRGMVLHRMVGTLDGTDTYFRFAYVNALTDWGVGTEYDDGKAKAGVIYRWNSVDTNQSGWASGPWEGGSSLGQAFVNKYGINAINRDLESIEVSGRKYENPIDDFTLEEVCELIAWRADAAKVPYTSWPINPHTGLSFLFDHSDFQAHKPCAGRTLKDHVPFIKKRVGEILKAAQVDGQARPPGPVTPAPAVIFVSFPKRVVFHTVPQATARQYANREAKIIRTFKERTAIKCGGYYLGEEVGGDNRWLVIVSGKTSLNARIHASGVEEEIPTFSAATRKDLK